MSFHQPSIWFLLALLLLPLLLWRWIARRRRVAVRFSSVGAARAAGRTWAVPGRIIVPALRALAVVLLIVCIARPRAADERTRLFSEGVAIEMVVDRSGSMRALDFRIDRRQVSRLDAVKQVVSDFVIGGDRLPGRGDDLIGMIGFALYADSRCPLTLDHEHLVQTVEATDFAPPDEDRTAIGDAMALGVERLRGLDEREELVRSPIKSRVMVLLTDGESNAGDIDPITAARMAAAYDIKVYTIGAGTDRGIAQAPIINPDGTPRRRPDGSVRTRPMPVSIDEATLREIADITGGEYFRATDTNSLVEVYARIDELERTEIEQQRYTRYRELAVKPLQFGRFTVPPLLGIVFILLALETLLASTRFRTLP